MKSFTRDNKWLAADAGWGNGYVIIPKGHPMHGKHYDEINDYIEVHQGLTMSEYCSDITAWEQITEEDKDGWVVGFDTAHWRDNLVDWPKERVEEETERLKEQLIALR